ncbi:hypothetical protein AEGHOMDF_1113 [Methylobacterium soli]|nr:hypothetical protein AEGHOMDF_1113 [Methylobacterium soli]
MGRHMRQIDYNEPVTLLWIEGGETSPASEKSSAKCSLGEAVLQAYRRWVGRPHERVCLIVRDGGKKPISTFKAVRSLYERPDFQRG